MVEQVPSPQLIEIWQHARATWPSVELGADAFLSHLARHVPAELPARDAVAQLNTTDLYLACACAAGDARAVATFEQHCLSGLDRVLVRMRLAPDAIAEVKQRIRFHLLVVDQGRARIAEFAGRGSLRTWVRVMGVREALRLGRQRREIAVDDTEKLQAFVMRENPGLEHAKAGYRRTFVQAFERALRDLPARELIMLRQYILDDLTIDQLGALYRVHRATAARLLARARRSVLATTRAYMRAELDVNSMELDSILRTIRSGLEISLRGLRRRPRP